MASRPATATGGPTSASPGSVTGTKRARKLREAEGTSRCSRRRTPLLHCLRPEGAQRAAGDQVALDVERVVGGGVHGDEALGGAGRLELLHLPFSPSHGLVRDLGAVVLPQAPLM